MIVNDFTKRRNIPILSESELKNINAFLVKDFVPKLSDNIWTAPRDVYGAQNSNWSNIPLDILYKKFSEKYNDSKKARAEAGKHLGFIIINLLRDLPEKFEIGVGFRTKLYKRILPLSEKQSNADENEQTAISKDLSHYNKEELKKRLMDNIGTSSDDEVDFHGKRYKRNNLSIAIIKHLRGYKCQICKMAIQKKDGNLYIEAAHIKPKSQQGPETPENILILCPNHHKEFDLGEREIITHTKEIIVFKLNGSKEYAIPLDI